LIEHIKKRKRWRCWKKPCKEKGKNHKKILYKKATQNQWIEKKRERKIGKRYKGLSVRPCKLKTKSYQSKKKNRIVQSREREKTQREQ